MSAHLLIAFVAATVIAYFVGGLPFGYWFVRLAWKEDIRKLGSGNIGATNVQRAKGSKAGLVVLALDILKGFLAVWIAARITGGDPIGIALGIAGVMLGHCYPVLLAFKGGKAVACFIGAFLYVAPVALAVVALLFVVIVALSNYISLASILGALVFPFVVWLLMHPAPPILAVAVFAAALIIYRHKANIVRLRNGTEHVFNLRGRNAS